jgi:hypothetical protein
VISSPATRFAGPVALALPLLVVCGCCCGGGGPKKDCLGQIEVDGRIYSPESGVSDEVEAQRNACNVYCLEADSYCEAVYGIWVTSAAGVAAGSPAKEDAMFVDSELLECITHTCADTCVADVNAGTLNGSVTCAGG